MLEHVCVRLRERRSVPQVLPRAATDCATVRPRHHTTSHASSDGRGDRCAASPPSAVSEPHVAAFVPAVAAAIAAACKPLAIDAAAASAGSVAGSTTTVAALPSAAAVAAGAPWLAAVPHCTPETHSRARGQAPAGAPCSADISGSESPAAAAPGGHDPSPGRPTLHIDRRSVRAWKERTTGRQR